MTEWRGIRIGHKLLLYWAVVVVWGSLIFYFSSQSVLPPALSSQTARGEWLRDITHVGEYAVLALLLHQALAQVDRFRSLPPSLRLLKWLPLFLSFSLALGAAVLFAAIDEWHQGWIPYRDASLSDLLFDIAGILLGLGTLLVVRIFRVQSLCLWLYARRPWRAAGDQREV